MHASVRAAMGLCVALSAGCAGTGSTTYHSIADLAAGDGAGVHDLGHVAWDMDGGPTDLTMAAGDDLRDQGNAAGADLLVAGAVDLAATPRDLAVTPSDFAVAPRDLAIVHDLVAPPDLA